MAYDQWGKVGRIALTAAMIAANEAPEPARASRRSTAKSPDPKRRAKVKAARKQRRYAKD